MSLHETWPDGRPPTFLVGAVPAAGALIAGVGCLVAVLLAYFGYEKPFAGGLAATVYGTAVSIVSFALHSAFFGIVDSQVFGFIRYIPLAGGVAAHVIGMVLTARDVFFGDD